MTMVGNNNISHYPINYLLSIIVIRFEAIAFSGNLHNSRGGGISVISEEASASDDFGIGLLNVKSARIDGYRRITTK